MRREPRADMRIESFADFQALIAVIETSPIVKPALATAALGAMRNGVITGEGPTTTGRMHCSRTIDMTDTALVKRILLAGNGAAVTRAEADALFDIHAAAFERADHGEFDDLFVKAIAHHVLASAGRWVPSRAVALSPATALADWASPQEIAVADRETGSWLAARMPRKTRHRGPLGAVAALIIGGAPLGLSLAALDLAA